MPGALRGVCRGGWVDGVCWHRRGPQEGGIYAPGAHIGGHMGVGRACGGRVGMWVGREGGQGR